MEVLALVVRLMCMSAEPAVAIEQWSAQNRRVALVSDNSEARTHFRELLEREGLTCAVAAESIEDLLSTTPLTQVDALLLHVEGVGGRCLEAFVNARACIPDIPIVAVWPDDQRDEDRRALKAGIDGLVRQGQAGTALIPTIHAVCSGLVCYPQRTRRGGQVATLSSREKQVLGMLVMGFSNAEIGRRLYLAESTVKSHLSSAYVKLGVRSRKDAAALILDPYEGLGTAILAIS